MIMSADLNEQEPGPPIPTMEHVAASDWREIVATIEKDRISVADLGMAFWRAAEEAEEQTRRRVFELFAHATSAMLDAESWNEPFTPFMRLAGKRSVIPSDLHSTEVAFLAEAAELVAEVPALQARFYDIAWALGSPRRIAHAVSAIETYTREPLTNDAWIGGAEDAWRRATFLSRRLGKATKVQLTQIESAVVEALLGANVSDGFLSVWLGDLLEHFGLARGAATSIGAHLRVLADLDRETGNHHRSQEAYRAAATWFERGNENEQAYACTAHLAESYVDQADNSRSSANVSNIVASTHLEKAVATLRSLPNTYRVAHSLDQRLEELQQRLRQSRKDSLGEMMRIESDPVDISDYVEGAKRLVSGHEGPEALLRFALVLPLVDVEKFRDSTIETMSTFRLADLFGGATLSADGRKVAETLGSTFSDDDNTAIFNRMVRDHQTTAGLGAQARILPALEVLMAEHRISRDLLRQICAESPVIPPDHRELWAVGLFAGFDGDYATAVHILVPQLESLIRAHLNDQGVSTLLFAENGVETEKSLGPLLAFEETAAMFSSSFQFELRALLTESHGANIRNAIAHGQLTDNTSWTTVTMYVWWLMFRLCYLPFWDLHSAGATANKV